MTDHEALAHCDDCPHIRGLHRRHTHGEHGRPQACLLCPCPRFKARPRKVLDNRPHPA